MNFALLDQLMEKTVAFKPLMARMTKSVTAGLMLSQAYYWSQRTKDPNGWFYKTQEEWEKETCLTRYEQEGARKILREKSFWEEKRCGIPAQLHYRINLSAFWASATANANEYQLTSSMRENHILDCGEPAIQIPVIPHTTICTESTSENTPLPAINAGGEVLRLDHSMPQTKRRGRPPTPPDPRFSPFIEAFSTAYLQAFKEKYYFQPKDAKQLQGFLRVCDKDLNTLMEIISWCWKRSQEQFCPAFVRAATIFDFCQNWPKIIVEAQKEG